MVMTDSLMHFMVLTCQLMIFMVMGTDILRIFFPFGRYIIIYSLYSYAKTKSEYRSICEL